MAFPDCDLTQSQWENWDTGEIWTLNEIFTRELMDAKRKIKIDLLLLLSKVSSYYV